MWKQVIVCTHLFAAHALCMTWISQEHLPFTFPIGLNSLVQNQLLTASPGQSRHGKAYMCSQNKEYFAQFRKFRYCLCVWFVLQEVGVLVCAKLSSYTQFQLASGFNSRGIMNITGTQFQHAGCMAHQARVCCASWCCVGVTKSVSDTTGWLIQLLNETTLSNPLCPSQLPSVRGGQA